METMLVVVTVVSLAFAVGMSVLAWKLLRDDRRRASARAAALSAAADGDLDFALDDEPLMAPDPPPLVIEVARPAPPVARPVAPRARVVPPPPRRVMAPTEPERRYADFDEADLDLVIEQDEVEEAEDDGRGRPVWQARPAARRSRVGAPSFGATVAAERGAPSRRWVALAVVAVFMAIGVGTVYAIYVPAAIPPAELRTEEPTASAAGMSGAQPLELLSLRHATDRDGGFTVTGLVQNPYGGKALSKVLAVVYVFDREGNYFATGKAALDFVALRPGDESPFVVKIRDVGRVGRYRVGFRFEDGGVAAHVDRRGQPLDGTTVGSEGVKTSPTGRGAEGS